jgi:hypothetical protein
MFSMIYYVNGGKNEYGEHTIYPILNYKTPGTGVIILLAYVGFLPLGVIVFWGIKYAGAVIFGHKPKKEPELFPDIEMRHMGAGAFYLSVTDSMASIIDQA